MDGYRMVTSGDVRLCVRDHGGDGPSMVCVHGAGGNIAAFDALADALAGSVRVIAYDQRGYGESDGASDLSLAAYVADLGAVVSAMCSDTTFVYGQSFGACVGLEYVASHPSRGFIDEDGPSCPMTEFCERAGIPAPVRSDVDDRHRREHFAGTPRDLDDLIAGLGLADTPFEPMLRRRMQPAEDGRLRSRPLPDELTRLVDEYQLHTLRVRDLYAALTVPVLWLAASHDGAVSTKRLCIEELVALHPATHVEWLDTGHTVSLERPDLVADLVRTFVGRPPRLSRARPSD